MAEHDGIAAWIICEDLLVKVKAELANEAILTLQNEVKAGRMKVEGRLVSSEVPSDDERDLFVANEIAKDSATMLRDYGRYIADREGKPGISPEEVEKIESAKKLMLAVEEISTLMHYRRVTEEWILEIEGIPDIDDPVKILVSTIHGKEDDRFLVLDFTLKRKSIKEEKIFAEEERKILESVLNAVH